MILETNRVNKTKIECERERERKREREREREKERERERQNVCEREIGKEIIDGRDAGRILVWWHHVTIT